VARLLCLLEALHLELIVLEELIGSYMLYALFLEDVLADLIKGLVDASIDIHEVADQVLVNHVLVSQGCLGQLLQVNWQILQVPSVLLDFAQLYSLHRVGLQHAHDEIFAVGRDLDWHAIVALLDLHEEDGQLLVIKWQAAADHRVQDDATAPYVDFLSTVRLA